MKDDRDIFHFKRFVIRHRDSVMKISQDSILLGAWAPLSECRNVLDIGCGTGLLSLQLAQRFPDMEIDAVELDELAADEAKYNVGQSLWTERIRVYHDSVQDYQGVLETGYDGIISNPPYFDAGIKPSQKRRSIARHQDELDYESLLRAVKRMINQSGVFCVILPTLSVPTFMDIGEKYGMFPQKLVSIFARQNKPSKRTLLTLGRKKTLVDHSQLVLFHRGIPTDEYLDLVREFYRDADSLRMTGRIKKGHPFTDGQ